MPPWILSVVGSLLVSFSEPMGPLTAVPPPVKVTAPAGLPEQEERRWARQC